MNNRSALFFLLMLSTFFAVNYFLPLKTATPPPSEQLSPIPTPNQTKRDKINPDEEFYLIENQYQQIVISSINGSIAEINLPFQTKENPDALVLPIREDLILEKEYPKQSLFPEASYSSYEGSFEPKNRGGYYPLLRRGVPVEHYSTALAFKEEPSSPIKFQLKHLEKNWIEMEGTINNTRIIKRYSLPEKPSETPYVFDMELIIEGESSNLTLMTGIPEVEIVSGNPTPSLKYRIEKNQKKVVEPISLPKAVTTTSSISPDWILNSNGFFGIIIDPQTEINAGFTAYRIQGREAPTRLLSIHEENHLYKPSDYPGYNLGIHLKNRPNSYHFRIFAGPLASNLLKQIDQVYEQNYFASKSFHGWFSFISEPFAQFLFFLMKIFYSLLHSWGGSIILLTVALRILLYPLNSWSIQSSIKLQKLAPKLSLLQSRYKKDPKKCQLEIMKLYREHRINPLGGCFPLIIQMPFLIGMFDLLKSTFELRGTPFIPNWIPDLAAPDILFSWSTPVWFIGNSFHLLPFLLGGVMFLQQKLSTNQAAVVTEQQKQQKFMANMMTFLFTFLFYRFPSGLNIYWLSSMSLGILQQSLTARYRSWKVG